MAEYSDGVFYAIEQLRQLKSKRDPPMIGGKAVGYAGEPHEFYLLSEYFNRIAQDSDLLEMLTDKSPVVRIMAAKCILRSKFRKIDKKLVDELLNDSQKVLVAPSGCDCLTMQVGEVIQNIKNPKYLE